MTTHVREREARVHSAVTEMSTPTTTSAPDAPRRRPVPETHEKGALPWTREVGIDARGPATPPGAVPGRWSR